ncbi:MAG: hypothetical protein EA383_04160 [Spirochaetaceae bacterium]|nr:MAG: hypothetical protein EA383_04160 [Spirochaetaceae bacterium]
MSREVEPDIHTPARKPAGSLDRALFRIMRMLESASLFLVSFSLSVGALYIIGNFQSFLDRSQFMLLLVLRGSSFLSVLVTAYYLAFLVMWMFRRRIFVLPRIVYATTSIVLLLMILFGAAYLDSVFGGA